MALTYRLTTLEQFKQYAKTGSNADDSLIATLIDAATEQIEAYCRNALVQRSFTEYFVGTGQTRIFLSKYPIQSVTSITDADSNTVAATNYFIRASEGYLEHIGGYWPKPVEQWTIVYTAGRYATTAAVAHNARVACEALVAEFLNAPRSPILSQSGGAKSVSYQGRELPPAVKALLEPLVSHA